MQLFSPSPVSFFQTFPDHVDHCFFGRLRLPIGLRVPRCGKSKLYTPVLAELLEVMAGELGSVVCDDFVRDPEPGDYVGPQKFHGLIVRSAARCLSFHPL